MDFVNLNEMMAKKNGRSISSVRTIFVVGCSILSRAMGQTCIIMPTRKPFWLFQEAEW